MLSAFLDTAHFRRWALQKQMPTPVASNTSELGWNVRRPSPTCSYDLSSIVDIRRHGEAIATQGSSLAHCCPSFFERCLSGN